MQRVHTIIIGSGAAGLCAAIRLKELGVHDILIATDGLNKGTSINTGSDKQTYYKLSLCGKEWDSIHDMAKTLFDGGSMHGDIALIEAAYSARCFLHLANLGVKFPTDQYGQFVGYKTDHDPGQRAASTGPYTSRDMCLALQKRVKELRIPVKEGMHCVELLTDGIRQTVNGRIESRCCGAVFLDTTRQAENDDILPPPANTILAENVIFAVGGPGDLYQTSVYPESQTTSIGLALAIGAETQNLPEMQFGLASIKHRWNVSGTYMQVIPRFVSTNQDGSDEQEFLAAHIDERKLFTNVFLKGYQWPFDVRKIDGSSLIDILVHIETTEKNRRVFLDYMQNPAGFDFSELSDEARTYLEKSLTGSSANRLLNWGTPIERLEKMNPAAIQLYKEHGIDLRREKLEIAVCMQHNNGGLAGTIWWESTNIKHLFPIGEVNGSHGVARPGGAALNAGQVGAFRAAEYIAAKYNGWTVDSDISLSDFPALKPVTEFSRKFMSKHGGMIRDIQDGRQQTTDGSGLKLTTRVYLDAIRFSAQHTGSRGSALVVKGKGLQANRLNEIPENTKYREKVLVSRLETEITDEIVIEHRWEERRPIPENELWFETVWKEYRDRKIYG